MSARCESCGFILAGSMLGGLCPRCVANRAFGPGLNVDGHISGYEIIRELGRGGAGVVYLARQIELDRLVALKVLAAGGHAGTTEKERFMREAREAARLQHANIVAIHEFGHHDHLPFYSMDLIEGDDLAAYAQRRKPAPGEAAVFTAKVARAVQHAHDAGVLHRDLKPANLLVDTAGEPHLTDFGLARALDGGDGLTRTGEVMGSPGYMAPEQIRGEATVATDVYGLGAVLYFLLTGRAPFVAARLPELLAAVEVGDPLPPRRLDPSLPRDLDTIALRALSRAPIDRYSSAAELAADLERYLAGKPIKARPISRYERTWSWARRNRKLSAVTAAFIMTVVVGGAGIVSQWRRAEHAAAASAAHLYSADLKIASDALLTGNVGLARRTLEACPLGQRDIAWGLLWPMVRGDAEAVLGSALWTVTHIAVSQDGALAATTSQADNVRLWDLEVGRLVAEFSGTATSWWAEFSPDGSSLFTADETVKLWDLQGRTLVREFPGMSGALSPDGQTLFTCTGHRFVWEGNPGTVNAWNVADGSKLFEVPTKSRVIALSFDGRKLAVSDAESSVSLLDARDGRELRTPWSSGGRLWGLEFSPDGTQLVASGWSPTVRLWDLSVAAAPPRLLTHPSGTWDTAFSRDGSMLAIGCSDQQVHVWDTRTWQDSGVLQGHDNEVWALAWQPDGRLLSSGRDPRLLRWRLAALRHDKWLHHDEDSMSVVWLPDARIASVHTFSGGAGATIVTSVRSAGPEEVLPGETPLAYDSRSDRLWLWTSPDGLRARKASDLADTFDSPWSVQPGETLLEPPVIDAPADLAWAALTDGSLIIQRLSDGLRVAHVERVFTRPNPIGALSPNGRWFVCAGASTELFIIDLADGRRASLDGHRYDVDSITFSPDGQSFATGGTDGLLFLWRTEKYPRRRALAQHLTSVGQIVFSPDGRVLISHEAGAGLHLSDIATGREVGFIEVRDEGETQWLGLSPDARWLGLRKDDGELRVFPIASRHGDSP